VAIAIAARPEGPPPPVKRLVRLGALGLALAGLGYSMLALSPAVTGATRTQFLSAPGIALFLAAAIGIIGRVMPGRGRAAGQWIVGGLLVALATGHAVAMQREWDRISFYTAQQRTLGALVRQAPGLQPNTLVLLLDEDGAWPFALTFRHALKVLYGDGVVGHALGSNPLLYSAALSGEGAYVAPWPVIRSAWHERPTFHRFDEIVVFRLAGGEVRLLETWPAPRLTPLPPLARYSPRDRITHDASPPRGVSWKTVPPAPLSAVPAKK
jgi:hypothetical protein